MREKNEKSGLLKVYIGSAINAMFWTFLFVYAALTAVVGSLKMERTIMEALNLLHIMFQTIWVISYILIWYGLNELSEYSKHFVRAKRFVLISIAANLFTIVTLNAYNTYLLNNDGGNIKYVHSNLSLFAIGIIIFFVINYFGARSLINGEMEIFKRYGADTVYEKKCISLKYQIVVATIGIVFFGMTVCLYLFFNDTTFGKVLSDIMNTSRESSLGDYIWIFCFTALCSAFAMLRIYVQIRLAGLTKAAHYFVKEISN